MKMTSDFIFDYKNKVKHLHYSSITLSSQCFFIQSQNLIEGNTATVIHREHLF